VDFKLGFVQIGGAGVVFAQGGLFDKVAFGFALSLQIVYLNLDGDGIQAGANSGRFLGAMPQTEDSIKSHTGNRSHQQDNSSETQQEFAPDRHLHLLPPSWSQA
jgi:hypothetical protein